MAEPEEVVAGAAHLATNLARRLWQRRRVPEDGLELSAVRRRLELLVASVFEQAPGIAPAQPPAPRSLLTRLAGRVPHHPPPDGALASTDGVRIRLPARIRGIPAGAALARYRLLALEQATRARRGTPAALPEPGLARDLYLLAEAAAVDRELVRLLPGLTRELSAARAAALAARPRSSEPPREAAVERLIRALLAAGPARPPRQVPAPATPEASRAWAEQQARRIRTLPGRYRGCLPVALWGEPAPPADVVAGPADLEPQGPRAAPPSARLARRPRVRASAEDEDDARPGTWLVRADDPQQSVEDPAGLQRPADRLEQADPGDLADSLSELPAARLVRTSEPPREVLASDDPPPRGPVSSAAGRPAGGLLYPEWDWRAGAYRLPGASVREIAGLPGDVAWAAGVLRQQAPLVRRVRREFERLRPRRQLLTRQTDGSDIDIDAYVAARADACAGAPAGDRVYLQDRTMRRDAAILLLADVSASTDSWIEGTRRTIDVEKEGLLIVGEALAALGDRHAVLAFRGEGARHVELLLLKRFAEVAGAAVRARIAGLEPDGFTRMGAAVRHATTLLAREPARHRLLLMLSDGRPNDVDVYEGRYGLEDTRQALHEARAAGVHPFCLTVDRQAPHYAPHVFGRTGYAVVQRAERFPRVLVRVLRHLLGG